MILIRVVARQTVKCCDSANQCNTTTGNHTFFNSCASSVQCIVDTVFLFFHFNFGSSTDFDYCNTAGKLGNSLLQLLTIVVRSCLFDLRANLLNACVDFSFSTTTVNDSSVVFVDSNFLRSTQIFQSDLLERKTNFFRDNLAAGQDSDILQHCLATITKARCFNRTDFNDATHAVNNQCCQRFAFYVFGDDQQWLARLGNSFQSWQQVTDVRDFLVEQQYIRIFKISSHGVLVVDEVRRQVTAVELHTFNNVKLVFEA